MLTWQCLREGFSKYMKSKTLWQLTVTISSTTDFPHFGESVSMRTGQMVNWLPKYLSLTIVESVICLQFVKWSIPRPTVQYYDGFPYLDLYALNTARNMNLMQIAHIPCNYKPEWIFPLKTMSVSL